MSDAFFKDKVVVVTGAGGTLCSVIARELASRGARVALLGRTLQPLQALAGEIAASGGTALPVSCDVTVAEAVEEARRVVGGELGDCWCLVNGAGGNQPEAVTTLTEFDPSELSPEAPAGQRGFFNFNLGRFEDVVRANTLGTVIPCQVFGRDLARLRRGSVLNFASMNSSRPLTRVPAYALAKAGIVNFTQWLAVYLAPAGVRVNGVAPGFFLNERSRRILLTEEGGLTARGRNVVAHTPLRRFGEAPELLGAVCWLLDDTKAGFVTGQTIAVDGGFLASAGV